MYKKKFHILWISGCLLLLCIHHAAFAYVDKHLLGLIECVTLEPEQIILPAKLDTGADYTSLHATDIEMFEHEAQPWVRFTTIDPSSATQKRRLEKPLIRQVRIKQSDSSHQIESTPKPPRRPVVQMTLQLAGQTLTIEVNLTDRSRFKYPMLIGKIALTRFAVIVDPSQQYTLTQPCELAS